MSSEPLNWQKPPPAACRGGALSIGNFDGVHRGHRTLLTELRQRAARVGGPAVVLTFDPHPLQLLSPERFQPLLTTIEDRVALLHAAGAERVAVLRTTPELLQLSARDFFARVVQAGFQAQALVEGGNFAFGRNREADVETLRRYCQEAGIDFAVVPFFQEAGRNVSSSQVRAALLAGDVRGAAALLGRCYRLRGTVVVGQRRGRTIGFPTANLDAMPTLLPGNGVYAVRVEQAGQQWPGAANIGPNPTFGEDARKVEIHLIGFEGDLYGQALAVDFVARLRDTRPFAGVAELKAQLQQDVDQARQLIANGAN
ncbi:MAG: bifunctional riboflavin kinase/FAD synthetase [Planctomycetia bacterium]|nr:bifunctional riboflavin kinase/FAD synthetase [Planctomycetia bacterium]